MTSRAWVALVVLVLVAFAITPGQLLNAQTSQTITLSYNGGACQQNGSSSQVTVSPTTSVTYQPQNPGNPFQVSFSSCPFATCPVTAATGAQTPTGTGTFNYASVTINGQTCNNPGALGLRVK